MGRIQYLKTLIREAKKLSDESLLEFREEMLNELEFFEEQPNVSEEEWTKEALRIIEKILTDRGVEF